MNKTKLSRIIIFIAIGVIVAGCFYLAMVQRDGPDHAASEQLKTDVEIPRHEIILTIETKDERIRVLKSPDGPRYAVETRKGKSILQAVDLDQLQAKHPRAYQLVTESAAGKISADLDL